METMRRAEFYCALPLFGGLSLPILAVTHQLEAPRARLQIMVFAGNVHLLVLLSSHGEVCISCPGTYTATKDDPQQATQWTVRGFQPCILQDIIAQFRS